MHLWSFFQMETFFIFRCCGYKLYLSYFLKQATFPINNYWIFLSSSNSAKNNTENDMNLNDGQTVWTLFSAICLPIIVVASFIVIVIILYIRKTSKLYRFTTKTSANTRYMCIFEWTTLIESLLLNLSYEVYSEKHLWCNQDRNINLSLKSGIKRLRNVYHVYSFISI